MNKRFTKYILYAIGEIILVVIGILIAIQLDTWRTERNNRNVERNYLLNMLEELKSDSLSHIGGWVMRYPGKMEGLKIAKDFYYGEYKISDTISFMNAIGKGGIGSVGSTRLANSTYLDLVSTGNFALIRDKSLRQQISYYYTYLDFILDYLNRLRSEYPKRLNSFRPFDPGDPGSFDKRDVTLFYESIQKPDMIELINQELTYGYSANLRYNDSYEICIKLSDSIRSYLKRTE
ncbi:hypothetical protein [Aegicerativicinus sediminis]|uniref:hypothetical protein n=1 Tax=Aegicerativicinus sediminis TaxID=2893202 RepID=UPI001E614C09|nr:hypothetical protein [Aegicerativicinus sediminis]